MKFLDYCEVYIQSDRREVYVQDLYTIVKFTLGVMGEITRSLDYCKLYL